ncbi:biotin--protein ligase isoform X2 [Cimex lectularius]|uniref:BPL/LPL catalytic domain-containing protein n=1 Tax=Cimex lectularius TaxID=79782 RepID=A0A8I6TDY9_CIMLE|nr:biotin--protein ligase isoform X2 [Cimex lectularius]
MLTVYYIAATWLQSRRLNTILHKVSTVHRKQGTVVVHQELPPYLSYNGGVQRKLIVTSVLSDYCQNYRNGQIADLMLYASSKRMVSIYPKQVLDISGWVEVLPGRTHLPIQLNEFRHNFPSDDKIQVLLEANYNTCQFNYSSKVLQVEDLGNPIAWFVGDRICILLEMNDDKLAYLTLVFMQQNITLENGIEIMRIESVKTTGTPYKIENTKCIPETYAQLDTSMTKEELKDSFMGRWRAHISMLCTFCDAISQVKSMHQDISVRHPGSGVGAVKLVPGSPKCKSLSPKQSIQEEISNGECSSITSNTCTVESPTLSVSNPSTEMSTAQGSTRLAADSTATSMSSLRSFPATPKKTQEKENGTVVKPPNIIILSDSPSSAEAVKLALENCLIRDRYTIYIVNFSDEGVLSLEHACLVVIHGNIPSNFTSHVMKYLLEYSGSLLCLCSDFIGSILPMFATAEVRPNELVRCSYKTWKHVPLMHHVFCYQPTPRKPQFTHDEHSSLRAIPESVQITDSHEKVHLLKVDILGAEETWQTPSLLLVSLVNSTSKIVFSQVHLEIDPGQYEVDDKKRQALEKSDKARIEIFSDVLGNHLGLKCSSNQKNINYTHGYFLGNHEVKQQFLNKLKANDKLDENCVLKHNDLTIKFCGKGINPGPATSNQLPVLLHSCPESFSTVDYFDNLKTSFLGRLAIFSEVMTSSMDLLDGIEMVHGFTTIPMYQTKGKGRSGNTWLSPKGCAMFSIQLHIPLDSNLGKHLSLLQHISSLAIVSSICELPHLKDLNIHLKWPNDIYANKTTKIGGVMATSMLSSTKAICNVGCGVNLQNTEPTLSINDLISNMSNDKKINIKGLTFEHYFACVFNKLEELIDSINTDGIEVFFPQYYTYWLHSDAVVSVHLPQKTKKNVRIKGIDSYGYLTVETSEGEVLTVQPDSNSFDMMAGLIVPKII